MLKEINLELNQAKLGPKQGSCGLQSANPVLKWAKTGLPCKKSWLQLAKLGAQLGSIILRLKRIDSESELLVYLFEPHSDNMFAHSTP